MLISRGGVRLTRCYVDFSVESVSPDLLSFFFHSCSFCISRCIFLRLALGLCVFLSVDMLRRNRISLSIDFSVVCYHHLELSVVAVN